jgi:hypothetical protein
MSWGVHGGVGAEQAVWRVTRSEFDAEAAHLDLYLGFDRGAPLGCPAKGCAQGCCPVHDIMDKTWRHLDFFSIGRCWPNARVRATSPKLDCCPWPAAHHRLAQILVVRRKTTLSPTS